MDEKAEAGPKSALDIYYISTWQAFELMVIGPLHRKLRYQNYPIGQLSSFSASALSRLILAKRYLSFFASKLN